MPQTALDHGRLEEDGCLARIGGGVVGGAVGARGLGVRFIGRVRGAASREFGAVDGLVGDVVAGRAGKEVGATHLSFSMLLVVVVSPFVGLIASAVRWQYFVSLI